ncbi:MAG: cohesin domain-containing protein [Candidatus Levyibacteriota bacterium]
MPRKTLALISGLVLVTVILFVVALNASEKQKAPQTPTAVTPQPTAIPVHSILTINPNPLIAIPGQPAQAEINIDTSDNDVTAVQLEFGYDPAIISNLKVTSGPMFTNPVVLLNKDNAATGRYTYAIGITPNSKVLKGQGVVANATFTVRPGTIGKSTQLGLLPTSLVTARGVAQSVLKESMGTVVNVSAVQPTQQPLDRTSTNTSGKPPVPPKGGF